MDTTTAPGADTDRTTGTGNSLAQAARAVAARAAGVVTTVAGRAGDAATAAGTRIGSEVHDGSRRMAALAHRRPIRWAGVAAGIAAALAATDRWRRRHSTPRSRAARAWQQLSHRLPRRAKSRG